MHCDAVIADNPKHDRGNHNEAEKITHHLLNRPLTLEKSKRKCQVFSAFLSTRHQVIVAESIARFEPKVARQLAREIGVSLPE